MPNDTQCPSCGAALPSPRPPFCSNCGFVFPKLKPDEVLYEHQQELDRQQMMGAPCSSAAWTNAAARFPSGRRCRQGIRRPSRPIDGGFLSSSRPEATAAPELLNQASEALAKLNESADDFPASFKEIGKVF